MYQIAVCVYNIENYNECNLLFDSKSRYYDIL